MVIVMRLIIIGAGGHGQVVADVAAQTGKYNDIIFLDDAANCAVGPCSSYEKYIDDTTEFYVAFGNNTGRLAWIEKLITAGAKLAVIVHPTAYVSPRAVLGGGTSILPNAIVNTDVVVGKGCIINIGAIVDHRTVLEDGVHLAPGAIVKAENHIAACNKVESGEVIEARSSFSRGMEVNVKN